MVEEYRQLAPIAKSYYGELSLCADPTGRVVMARRLALGADVEPEALAGVVARARGGLGLRHEHVVPMRTCSRAAA
jgi:hypothetical protein